VSNILEPSKIILGEKSTPIAAYRIAYAIPLRLFLVEDSPAVREIIRVDLECIPGMELVGFSESENDALIQLSANKYDILILDIELKQGNGINLLRALRQQGLQTDALKIIFSNNASDSYRRVSKNYGVDFFFDKCAEFLQMRALLQKMARPIIAQ